MNYYRLCPGIPCYVAGTLDVAPACIPRKALVMTGLYGESRYRAVGKKCRHLLVKLEKSGLGSKEVCRSAFDGHSKDGELQKLHSHILINSAFVDDLVDFKKIAKP